MFPIPYFPNISQFLFIVLEEELDTVRREVTDFQRRLGEVEDQREALEDGALAVCRMVVPRAPMRVDQLHALPDIIRSAVRLGIHRGAAACWPPSSFIPRCTSEGWTPVPGDLQRGGPSDDHAELRRVQEGCCGGDGRR